MSIRNLDALFHPTSIALIGASSRPKSIGAVLAANLLTGGFDGPIMPVNPKAVSINGVLSYRDVQSLPITPDMAVIATPPASIPALIDELGARGTRAAVVITAGLRDIKDARRHVRWSVRCLSLPRSTACASPVRTASASSRHRPA